jgi:hypothetical protein
MQSIANVIVICLERTAAERPGGQAAGCDLWTSASQSQRNHKDVLQTGAQGQNKKAALRTQHTSHRLICLKPGRRLLVVLGLEDFTATVKTVRADVVTQVRFTGGWLDAQLWRDQEVVRTVHTALRRGFLILLNCHDTLLNHKF